MPNTWHGIGIFANGWSVEDQEVFCLHRPTENVRKENQSEEIESESTEGRANDAMVDFSTEDAEGNQSKIVNEVTEK